MNSIRSIYTNLSGFAEQIDRVEARIADATLRFFHRHRFGSIAAAGGAGATLAQGLIQAGQLSPAAALAYCVSTSLLLGGVSFTSEERAFTSACEKGDTETVRAMLRRGFFPIAIRDFFNDALLRYPQETLFVLIEEIPPRYLITTSFHGSPLERATHIGRIEVALALIQRLSPEQLAFPIEGRTYLHRLIAYPTIVRPLVAKLDPAALMIQDAENKDTPLHAAVRVQANADVFEALFEKVPPHAFSIQNKQGQTPLRLALSYSTTRDDLIASLIERSSPEDLMIRDENENTALHLVLKQDKLQAATAIIQKLPLKWLMMQNKEGDTPLHQACRLNQLEMVSLLATATPLTPVLHSFFFILGPRNAQGQSALQCALSLKNFPVVKKLVKRGATLFFFPPTSLRAIAANQLGIGVLPPDHPMREELEQTSQEHKNS